MAYNKNENGFNEEQVASFLSDALNHVETDSDPETLNQLKKLFKKNIPFSRRMYVAAWLVKQATAGGNRGGSRFGRNDRNDRGDRNERFSRDRNDRGGRFEDRSRGERNDRVAARTERAERTERAPAAEHGDGEHTERAPRVQIDPSMATTIFIGIGRNRRVYPRDLVGLLVSVAGLDRERIGDIRVLANYSFIQLFTEDCEKAIAALNGYDYRGRKLSVSYSRQKEEGEDDAAESDTPHAVAETAASEAVAPETAAPETSAPVNAAPAEEAIPENVRNDSHSVHTESSEEAQIAAEQKAFAAQQSAPKPADVAAQTPFSETADDGQVKSHFSSTDSNYLV